MVPVSEAVMDALMLLFTIGFFLLCGLYVLACERL
jgi:hypothetical protein